MLQKASERYLIERTLGRGGMATVYLARDRALERDVALKVLAEHFRADEALRHRFLREARVVAKLLHPNVVRIYDVGEDERGPFIVMEYVEGETLADELHRRGRLPASEVVSIGLQLCSALEAAHSERLVHRDLKPQNVLRGEGGQVKLVDFGIARSLTGTSHTELGTVLGTAAYLAPEQARGEPVTAAADIYSLGVVLYELLTSRTPFGGKSLSEVVLNREQGTIEPPSALVPDVPPRLEAVVMHCLALRPEDRPDSAAAVARELAASRGDSVRDPATAVLPAEAATVALRPEPADPARQYRGSRRRRWVAAGIAVAGLLALVAGAVIAWSGSDRPARVSAPTAKARPPASSPVTTASTAARSTAVRSTAATGTSATTVVAHRPATPEQAIAALRAAIYRAELNGSLPPGPANDLDHRLDDISQSLVQGNSDDAGHKLADLIHQVSQLAAQNLQHGGDDLSGLAGPLNELAALLPAHQPPRGHSAAPDHHGKAKGRDKHS